MNTLANVPQRRYSSPLREGQAGETRDRILDGALTVLSRGLAAISIPAVAREAGVSIPTVYRHFATKGDLLEAIYPHAVRRAKVEDLRIPASLEEFRDGVRSVFDRAEAFDEVARAAVASHGVDEVRHATMGSRIATTRRIAEAIAPSLTEPERQRLTRILIVLTMSASARMLRTHLGLSADEAADDVDWAVRAMIAGSAPSAAR